MSTSPKSIFSGYSDLYSHPETYDDTFFGGAEGEETFYTSLVKKAKNVLYLGSGSGRLMKTFLKVNKNVTGIEIQKEMVSITKKRLPSARVLQTDILELDLDEQFDLILAPYLFTCHFESHDVAKLFGVVSKHLQTGGLFAGDMFSPYLPHDRTIDVEINEINIEGDVVEKVYCAYDHEEQICTEYVEKTNMKTHDYSMVSIPWNYYYPEQLEKMMTAKKMKIQSWYGTFEKDAVTKDTPELIWIAQKV